jgi:hypothetical protein
MFTPTVSGLYGNQQAFDNISTDYSYWNAGLALGVENLTFDFRYWDTDISNSDCGSPLTPTHLCDSRFVFSTTLSLP